MWGEETSEKAGKATDGAWHGRPGWEAGGGRRRRRSSGVQNVRAWRELVERGVAEEGRGSASEAAGGPGACGLRDG